MRRHRDSLVTGTLTTVKSLAQPLKLPAMSNNQENSSGTAMVRPTLLTLQVNRMVGCVLATQLAQVRVGRDCLSFAQMCARFTILQGLYSTTKSIYSSYVPESASGLIKSLATTLIAAAAPVATKVIPSEPKASVPSDLGELDTFLDSFLSAGDAKIDSLLASTVSYFDAHKQPVLTCVNSTKASLENKVGNTKNYVFGRYNEVKPLVATKVGEAKAVVVKRLEDPEVVKILDRATPYYTAANEKLVVSTEFVKENMEPAKAVLSDMCTSAKSAIVEQGVAGCALASAEICKSQTLTSVEVLKKKGALEGTRELGGSLIVAVTAALDEKKPKACTQQGAEKEEVRETDDDFVDSVDGSTE